MHRCYGYRSNVTSSAAAAAAVSVNVVLLQPIERPIKSFRPLVVPRELQKALPFKDKPKLVQKAVDTVARSRVAVVREPKERQVCDLISSDSCSYT